MSEKKFKYFNRAGTAEVKLCVAGKFSVPSSENFNYNFTFALLKPQTFEI